MDNSSLLVPLTRAARHLAESAQRAIAAPAQALREQAEAQQPDLARATAQFVDAAQDTIAAARAAARPYRRQAARVLANSQDRLQSFSRSLDAGMRQLVPGGARRNVIARHPYATTFVVLGVGYLAFRQWRRRHAESSTPSEPEAMTRVEQQVEPTASGGDESGQAEE